MRLFFLLRSWKFCFFFFVWLCLVGGLSQFGLVLGLRFVPRLCFTGRLVVAWVGCVHNYVGAMLGLVGWSCEGMLEAWRASQVGCFCASHQAKICCELEKTNSSFLPDSV